MTLPTPSAKTDLSRQAIRGVSLPSNQRGFANSGRSHEAASSVGQVSETPNAGDPNAGRLDPATIRLISETAHDLRAPLTTIRESVRLVRDEVDGRLSLSQKEFLGTAIEQCECVDQMVDEMVQMQRLNSGFPRARRRWVSIGEIKEAVGNTLKPWTMPRNIHVLWDGPTDMSIKVFGDVAMLRRLVVNLVTNAVRVTPEGDPILVRVVPIQAAKHFVGQWWIKAAESHQRTWKH